MVCVQDFSSLYASLMARAFAFIMPALSSAALSVWYIAINDRHFSLIPWSTLWASDGSTILAEGSISRALYQPSGSCTKAGGTHFAVCGGGGRGLCEGRAPTRGDSRGNGRRDEGRGGLVELDSVFGLEALAAGVPFGMLIGLVGRSRFSTEGPEADVEADADALVAGLKACGTGPVLYLRMRRVAYSLRRVSWRRGCSWSRLTHTSDLRLARPGERSAGSMFGSSQLSGARSCAAIAISAYSLSAVGPTFKVKRMAVSSSSSWESPRRVSECSYLEKPRPLGLSGCENQTRTSQQANSED